MASVLPFNQILLDGVELAGPEDFVELTLAGEDSAVTTADAMIHNFRSAVTPSATCELLGDKRSKEQGAPSTFLTGQSWPEVGGTVVLKYVPSRGGTATTVYTINGALLGIEYNASDNKSSVNISGCEAAY